MENQSLIQKILVDTQTLMTLKVDNAQVVKDKFSAIRDRVEALATSTGEPHEAYQQAATLIQQAMNTSYQQFCELTDYEQKGQALIELRHKAAEVCELLQAG